MPARLIRLEELQPTDALREPSLFYLESLSNKQLIDLGLPEVWQTPSSLLISDGNHRAAIQAKRGIKEIKVDYKKLSPSLFASFESEFESMIERAQNMRKQGVYNPYDFWRA